MYSSGDLGFINYRKKQTSDLLSLSLFSFREHKYVIEGCFFGWPPPSKAPARPRRKIFRWTPGLMPSDFKQWQKDSPYGCLDAARIEQSCLESQRCFGEPKAHLFGVCCIIRTRELATRERLIVYPSFLFLFFRSVENKFWKYITWRCAAGRVEDALLRPRDISANT